MTRVVLTASISFSRVRRSYSDARRGSVRFGSVRLGARVRPASFRDASQMSETSIGEIQWVLFCTYVAF